MAVRHYRLNEDFVASDVMGWYDKAVYGDAAVITLPSHPSVRLLRSTNEHVFWCPEGGRGVTISLENAIQRLAMFQDMPPGVPLPGRASRPGDIAGHLLSGGRARRGSPPGVIVPRGL